MTGTENAGKAAEAHGAILGLHSTDYVFDGQSLSVRSKYDRPDPQTEYGRTKRMGESWLRNIQPFLLSVLPGSLVTTVKLCSLPCKILLRRTKL